MIIYARNQQTYPRVKGLNAVYYKLNLTYLDAMLTTQYLYD